MDVARRALDGLRHHAHHAHHAALGRHPLTAFVSPLRKGVVVVSSPRPRRVLGCAALLTTGALGLCTPAWAQPAPTPPTAPTAPTERAVLDEAQSLLLRGQSRTAYHLLDTERTRRALDPEGTSGVATLARLAQAWPSTWPPPAAPATWPAGLTTPTPPSPSGSSFDAVLLYGSMLGYGLATGLFLNLQLGVDDLRAAAWLPLLGAGAGLVGAWALDRPLSRRAGGRASLNTGLVLGALGGGAVAWQRAYRGGVSGLAPASAAVWAGTTVGAIAGVGLGLLLDPSPGTVSFVQSGGVWGGALGLLTGLAVLTRDDHGLYLAAGEALGAVGAAIAARVLHPTPSRIRWMDLGVLAGALVGTGVAFLVFYEADARAASLATVQLCMIGGGVAGYLFGASRAPPRPEREREARLRWHPQAGPGHLGFAMQW